MRFRIARLLVPGLTCAAVVAATAQSPALSRADSAFQRQDWPRSASLYDGIVRADTTNGLAWFRLGASLESQHDLKGAIDAYGHAAALRFQPVVSELRLSRSFAQSGDSLSALAHLRAAAGIGFPLSLVASDPGFAALRQLPAYAEILKAAEDARFPCRSQHAFDYWEGVFHVTPWAQPDVPSVGTVTNTREYDGCTFVEHWNGGPMSQGMSMVFYDTNRHAWRMIWNDDRNGSNDFEGEYKDGAMRFTGWVLNPAGKKVLTSNVLMDVSPDIVHHIFSTSDDSGKTWIVRSSSRWTRQH